MPKYRITWGYGIETEAYEEEVEADSLEDAMKMAHIAALEDADNNMNWDAEEIDE
jgi:hypothetical protein